MKLSDFLRKKMELALNWIAFIACLLAFIGLYEGIYQNDYRLIFYCIGTFIITLVLYKLISEDE